MGSCWCRFSKYADDLWGDSWVDWHRCLKSWLQILQLFEIFESLRLDFIQIVEVQNIFSIFGGGFTFPHYENHQTNQDPSRVFYFAPCKPSLNFLYFPKPDLRNRLIVQKKISSTVKPVKTDLGILVIAPKFSITHFNFFKLQKQRGLNFFHSTAHYDNFSQVSHINKRIAF